jgi:hypothetical protein
MQGDNENVKSTVHSVNLETGEMTTFLHELDGYIAHMTEFDEYLYLCVGKIKRDDDSKMCGDFY